MHLLRWTISASLVEKLILFSVFTYLTILYDVAVSGHVSQEDILKKYNPVAMDESWSLYGRSNGSEPMMGPIPYIAPDHPMFLDINSKPSLETDIDKSTAKNSISGKPKRPKAVPRPLWTMTTNPRAVGKVSLDSDSTILSHNQNRKTANLETSVMLDSSKSTTKTSMEKFLEQPINGEKFEETIEPIVFDNKEPSQDSEVTDMPIPLANSKPSRVSKGVNMPKIYEVEDSKGKSIADSLFWIPTTETPALTRLITGKENPLLVSSKIAKPEHVHDKRNRTIAQYSILVPIYIPAVKSKPTVSPPPQKVTYVKETHTKMVPVKKNVARVKTLFKAEKVPQKIITNFVSTKDDVSSIPVEGKLRPDEKVIESVVTDYV